VGIWSVTSSKSETTWSIDLEAAPEKRSVRVDCIMTIVRWIPGSQHRVLACLRPAEINCRNAANTSHEVPCMITAKHLLPNGWYAVVVLGK
jgi:hypothetical protein